MARKTKVYKEDKFYFEVNNIAIYRDNEETARKAFEDYEKVGKNATWLGMWDGKNFVN